MKRSNANTSKALVPANTSVPSPKKSSNGQDGNSLRPSAQDAVPASILIDNEYCENDANKLRAVLALLQALMEQMWNPDARSLAARSAIRLLEPYMSHEEAAEVVTDVLKRIKRRPQLMDGMF